ncbi:MAG: RIP metalloprotease RseP [Melioribacteraceae bacterium]|nr:RIP metalloprotease RseP [Melioribacteraceae bacterium]MCF8263579.1 RIP metalloprotease RseP [Melioribacteraceae bacterium]MCF8430819.1 RIP metalloprotease RseP [Melioribacteraceae bacterium]
MDQIFYFIITIAILVFVHEFGHFAAARICKMQTDVFAIGFGKRLFGWNQVNGFTWGDMPEDFDMQGHTDYRLCALPLGGYVKIAGMVDESFDTKFAEAEPKPYEFRAKPTYQKLFVITAGVMMNLTLTILIFWGINFDQGKQVIKTTQIGIVEEGTAADQLGFESHDKILSVNGESVESWDELRSKVLIDNALSSLDFKAERNGNIESISVSKNQFEKVAEGKFFLSYDFQRPIILDVLPNSPAEDAGIEAGDIFVELNSEVLKSSGDLIKIVSANPEVELPVVLVRNEDTIKTSVTPGMEGLIGVSLGEMYTGPKEIVSFGFFESLGKSLSDVVYITGVTYSMLKNVITGEMPFNRAFGGPVRIAEFAAKSADTGMVNFLYFLAQLSLSLAILNILPFPVLDGGHFVIISIEGILRRELPLKVKIAIQNTGFVILMALMAFIIYADIFMR